LIELFRLAQPELEVLNRLNDWLLRELSDIHPMWLILLPILVTGLVMALYCRLANRRYRERKDQEISTMVN